jgi:hypothetical protein
MCFNITKKEKNILCFYFCVFLVDWQNMMKKVGEITSKMEKNTSIPRKFFQGYVD